MTNDSDDLLARFRALPPEEQARLLAGMQGGPAMQDANAGRDVNVATNQTITNLAIAIYGPDPELPRRERLARYLDRLAARTAQLPLHGLDAALDKGDGITLDRIYVMLATESLVEVARGEPAQLRRYFAELPSDISELTNDYLKYLAADYHPEQALPDQAIVRIQGVFTERSNLVKPQKLLRNQLAAEAVATNQRLVLRGDPGSGKSTFVRHLAWELAERSLADTQPDLHGWEQQAPTLPVLLSLRALAGRLASEGAGDATVFTALRAGIEDHGIADGHELLSQALHSGAALLLFDGLDEVPLEAVPGTTVDRATVLQALHSFGRTHRRARMLLTTRTRAFEQPAQAQLGWPVETLAPFTPGQIRHFVPAWYHELAACGQLSAERAETMSGDLLAAIETSARLREMAETPLLLTLMALLLYNKGELPRDRPQLYERILELLLGQWDKRKQGQSLAEVLDLPDWDSRRLRPLLDRLSYQAHLRSSSSDGRGRLPRAELRNELISFFEQAGIAEGRAMALAGACLDYFNLRSGLLVPDDDSDSYVFAHLTLQEHCAGRHLAIPPQAVTLIMQHRDQDRWQVPIMLGLGVVQPTNPHLIEIVLRRLLDRHDHGKPKDDERWYRDLLLAADIGVDRDWNYLREQGLATDELRRTLAQGLATMLNDRRQLLPVAERVRAGFLLGDLGDPRFPVTLDDWRNELAKIAAGDESGYFCRVPAGSYLVGSSDDDPDARDEEKPQYQFQLQQDIWIARYPVTNAQWQAWVATGGNSSYAEDDSDLNRANQPVVSIQWHWCNSFCEWLSNAVANRLPAGYVLRLPAEAEREAAARGGDGRIYPWGDEWNPDYAATQEDQETRGWEWSTPVGCYPAGAAPCGAVDMAGNVWEWTADIWQSHPGAKEPFTDDGSRVIKGGYYSGGSTDVRCGARLRYHPDFFGIYYGDLGFRIVVAPLLAHLS